MRIIFFIFLFTAILVGGFYMLDHKEHLNHQLLSKEDKAKIAKLPRP